MPNERLQPLKEGERAELITSFEALWGQLKTLFDSRPENSLEPRLKYKAPSGVAFWEGAPFLNPSFRFNLLTPQEMEIWLEQAHEFIILLRRHDRFEDDPPAALNRTIEEFSAGYREAM